jgi:chromosome segregation ATPase
MVGNVLIILEESLENIDFRITKIDKEISSLDHEITHCIREQAYESESVKEELANVNSKALDLFDKISQIKDKAEMSENMVKSICAEIRSLDYAKKNITFTITSLKRLIMLSKLTPLIILVTGIEQLRSYCIEK